MTYFKITIILTFFILEFEISMIFGEYVQILMYKIEF